MCPSAGSVKTTTQVWLPTTQDTTQRSFLAARCFSSRSILIHIGLIYLFESGLATRIIHAAEPPIETNIVQDVKQRDAPPPPPPPKMERPPVEVPPPDVVINLPAEPTSTAITNTTTKHVEAPPPVPKAPDCPARARSST